MIDRLKSLLVAIPFLGFGGCVHLTPYEVERCWFDWNSQRHLNIQCETFDHLPPTAVRTRLMRWGYNVGPGAAMPVSGGLSPWSGPAFSAPVMGAPVPDESAPMLLMPGSPNGNPADAAPPIPPPAPPADKSEPNGEQGPQGKPDVTAAGYQIPAGTSRPVNATWMYSK
jgi:hypothetical protein